MNKKPSNLRLAYTDVAIDISDGEYFVQVRGCYVTPKEVEKLIRYLEKANEWLKAHQDKTPNTPNFKR